MTTIEDLDDFRRSLAADPERAKELMRGFSDAAGIGTEAVKIREEIAEIRETQLLMVEGLQAFRLEVLARLPDAPQESDTQPNGGDLT